MSYIGTEPKDIRSFGRTKFDYTATQGQTAFTGADDDGKVLAFTVGQIEVYVNGILMDDSDFTTTGTGTVTLASAANLNDVVNVVSFETNIPDSNYVPASGGTFTGNVTNSGNVTVGGTLGVTGVTTMGTLNTTGLNVTQTGSTTAKVGATGTSGDNDGTLIISNGGSGDGMLRFDYETNTDRARIGVTTSGQDLKFYTAGNNERMKIDNSGRVTIPNQPSFMVRANTGNHSISAGHNSATGFNNSSILHNVGNHYNNSNATFTAPVDGRYHVALNIYTQTTGGTAGGYIGATLNFSNLGYVYSFAENGGDVNLAFSGIFNMSANDTVSTLTYGHAGRTQHYIGQHSYFSGHLLG